MNVPQYVGATLLLERFVRVLDEVGKLKSEMTAAAYATEQSRNIEEAKKLLYLAYDAVAERMLVSKETAKEAA